MNYWNCNIGDCIISFTTQHDTLSKIMVQPYKNFFIKTNYPPNNLFLNFDLITTDKKNFFNSSLSVETKNNTLKIFRKDFIVNIDFKSKKGTCKLLQNIHSFGSLLRIIYSFLLVKNHGFVLHSSGFVSNNAAYLFTGKSGSGKSSIIKKFCEINPKMYRYLSDDLIVVKYNNVFFAYSSPFQGSFTQPVDNFFSRIKKVFFISSDSSGQKIKTIKKTDYVRLLLNNILFFGTDKTLIEKLLQTVDKFSTYIEAYSIPFNSTTDQLIKLLH